MDDFGVTISGQHSAVSQPGKAKIHCGTADDFKKTTQLNLSILHLAA